MFGGVPAQLIFDLARKQGAMFQLELDLGLPEYFFVRPEFICDVPKQTLWYNAKKERHGSYTHEDHPSFAATRKLLENKGYIKTEQWHNGDTVLKPFYFNNLLLEEGDTFYCAAYWSHHTDLNYNDGVPI